VRSSDTGALDAFALPPQTTARFWLLVVTTLASGNTLTAVNVSAFPALERVLPGPTLLQSLASMAVVLAGALLIWWAYPWAKIRRRHLRPLPDHPALVAALRAMCAEVGLRTSPTFLWNPLRPAPAAIAFGRIRTRYIGLSGGLVVQFGRDRDEFRAIVLHELAHLRNGDVAITYFAVALWWSFVAVVLVPFVLFGLLPNLFRPTVFAPAAWLGAWWWRILALTLLVYLTRNSVLRTRETYADIRAASWDGPSGALRRVVERLPRQRWWRGLGLHPDPRRRRLLFDDPSPLFRVGFWEALGTGCTLAIANVGLVGRTALLADPVLVLLAAVLDGLLVSFVAAGVIGVGLWREAFAAARDRARRGWLAAGLGLAAGLVLGPTLSLEAPTLELTGTGRFAGLQPTSADLVVDAFAVAGSLLVAGWIAVTARAWLAWRLGGTRPRLALATGVLATGVVLGSFVEITFALTLLAGTGESAARIWSLPLLVLLSPYGVPLVATLWAFPLAGEVLAGRLEGDRPVSGPRREVLAGLCGGLAFWPLYLVDVLVLHPPGPLSSPVLALCVLEAVVGGAIAASARRPAVPRALLSAWVAACVTLPLGLLALPGAGPVKLLIVAGTWINGGTLVALPFALLGARRASGGTAPPLQ
jgi:Zn-dependent protease with chaperone function